MQPATNEISLSLEYNMTERVSNHTVTVQKFGPDVLLLFMDCLVNALIIISNLFLAGIILCKSNLRRKLFYWRVLNLCFSDLIIGLVVLPFGISYTHNYVWLHGDSLCQVYVILDITHFGFSALVITTICIDRLLSKTLEIRPDQQQTIKYIQIFIFIMPWIFTLAVFLPMLLSSVRTMGVFLQNMCGFILHSEMLIPTAVVAYLVPNMILIFTTIAMLVMYKAKRATWYRITEDGSNGSDTTTELKSTTVATLIVSCVTVAFWFPYLVNVFIMVTCRSFSCFPGIEVFRATLFLCTLTSFFTPLMWLSDQGIRNAAKEFVHCVRLFCKTRVLRVSESSYNQQFDEENL